MNDNRLIEDTVISKKEELEGNAEELRAARARLEASGIKAEVKEIVEKVGVLADKWVDLKNRLEATIAAAEAILHDSDKVAQQLYEHYGMAVPRLGFNGVQTTVTPTAYPDAAWDGAPTQMPITTSVAEIRQAAQIEGGSEESFASSIASTFGNAANLLRR